MERLVSTSENLLLKYGQTTSQAHVKKLKDLVIVQLNGLYLKNVRHLQYCVLLKVCILSNNYITDIDALECCTHLVKLDLHGNQVNTTVEEEINVVKDIIAKINHILAHHSPVVIVQRWIRGYLTRKRFGYPNLESVDRANNAHHACLFGKWSKKETVKHEALRWQKSFYFKCDCKMWVLSEK
uniref:Leucine rich repeats and IQ motif containing 3 n=1 Tax=Terrapene triunguis TaxID=2587831 RepID=A0A674ITQ6_9SAUR